MNHVTHTDKPLLISVADAAALLAVSPITIRRMLKAGELPKVQVAGAVRIPYAAVVALATRSGAFCDTSTSNADEDDAPRP